DDEMIREIVEELLSDFFDVFDTAVDGKDGYDKYQVNGYDIVLSDITMPIMDGIELGTVIKEENPEQKFVVVSAHGDSDYLLALTKIGVDGFIQKPVGKSLFPVLYKVAKCVYLDKKEQGLI
ncbi:MAG: response regulator, partial [Campylobacterales bacterium]|nr:response regulator [Campylobacterales bacterium]